MNIQLTYAQASKIGLRVTQITVVQNCSAPTGKGSSLHLISSRVSLEKKQLPFFNLRMLMYKLRKSPDQLTYEKKSENMKGCPDATVGTLAHYIA